MRHLKNFREHLFNMSALGKKIKILLLACIVAIPLTSCFEDMDDNISFSSLGVKDFVWKGMNLVYLYKPEVPDLANDRFTNDEDYNNYLNGFDTPEDLFESLKYLPDDVDRFSRIYSNYLDLQNLLSGTSLSNGLEFNLYFVPGSDSEIFGAITLVLNNSPAENAGLQRGQIFRAINNQNLNLNNFNDLLELNSYTLNFADYDDNGTTEIADDTVILNGETEDLTKVAYTENPVYKTEVLSIDGINIGYLMYNRFTSNFNSALNSAFSQFQAEGVTELVLDLRYNGGGSVQTAAYLGSMITGQFNGEVFSKTFHNDNLQNLDTNYVFTNSIEGGGSINSLNLNKVYVLTTNNRTASASELVINSLKPYIDVVVIGQNTAGKTQASQIVYDSSTLFTTEGINPNHSYAMLPLIANSTNVNDQLVPSDGLVPDIEIAESPLTFGVLGDVNEPLLAAAISEITLADRPLQQIDNYSNSWQEIKSLKLESSIEKSMFIE
ncbi:S41 family peptidase [Winogradskyella pulchriflava]|uniref:S41 family peptidase n=1 Tax=Winogradskyella pulchriflava TaxID=1110688 RepID=A0ABV6Q7A9_9FLAO